MSEQREQQARHPRDVKEQRQWLLAGIGSGCRDIHAEGNGVKTGGDVVGQQVEVRQDEQPGRQVGPACPRAAGGSPEQEQRRAWQQPECDRVGLEGQPPK